MQNYIHQMDDFSELFEKIDYKEEKLWVPYTILMLDVIKKDRVENFSHFLLKYLSKSDTIFIFSKTKFLIVLEETAIRWAIQIDEKIRKKAKKHWCKCKFYTSAVQWYSIEDEKSLFKALKRRLKKAKECKKCNFIHSLSEMNYVNK